MIRRGSPFEDRFIPEPNSGCWLWLGATNNKGYSVINVKIGDRWRTVLASRFSYEKYRGPIPAGQLALHKCDTPICVNPDHLFTGTHHDNTQDAVQKGRMHSGESSGPSKLTSEQVREIRQAISDGATQRELGIRFEVDRSHISRIASREYWREV